MTLAVQPVGELFRELGKPGRQRGVLGGLVQKRLIQHAMIVGE